MTTIFEIYPATFNYRHTLVYQYRRSGEPVSLEHLKRNAIFIYIKDNISSHILCDIMVYHKSFQFRFFACI